MIYVVDVLFLQRKWYAGSGFDALDGVLILGGVRPGAEFRFLEAMQSIIIDVFFPSIWRVGYAMHELVGAIIASSVLVVYYSGEN